MALAVTGNKIIDAQARLGKARADAEARKKSGSDKGKGGGKGKRGAKSRVNRGKTNAKALAGRSAGKAKRGRGIAGTVNKSRAGASKSITYALDKKDAKFINSNAGLTAKDISNSFKMAAESRKDIIKNTAHESYSLPVGQKLSDEKWADVVDLIRKEKGLDDGFPFVCGLHSDTDHQHIHLVYSRVSYDGRVVDDRFSKVRMAAIEDLIEDKFNLKLVPKPPTPTAPSYSKNESEMAIRTGTKPPRFAMLDAINEAKKGKPDVMTFVQRLKAQGVTARPAIKNGKMSGFSFAHKNVELGASSIHNQLGWANLQKGINYVSDKDDSKLAKHAASLAPRAEGEQLEQVSIDREIPAVGAKMERPTVIVKAPEPRAFGSFDEDKKKPFVPNRRPEIPEEDARRSVGGVTGDTNNNFSDTVTTIKKTPAQMLADLKEKHNKPTISEKDMAYYRKRMGLDSADQIDDQEEDRYKFPTM